ncbi:MAG: hypothetical protein LIO87_11245 [Eubacterium sp.]|nr:hypothetical protein [Eubacterium sp.]
MKKLFITLILILFPVCVFGAEVKVNEKYMEDTGFYRYSIDDDNYITSSVRLESVIDNIVKISFNDYVSVVIYKDGKVLEFHSGDYIYGDGEYTIVIKNGDDIGRIKFILNTISLDTLNLEDSFYNHINFEQTYDSERNMFKESMGELFSLYTTVPDGALTEKGVKINFNSSDQDAYITVMKDGEEIDYKSGSTITEAGCYSVNVVYDVDRGSYEDLKGVTESDLYSLSDEDFNYNDSEEDYYSGVDYIAETASFTFRIVDTPQNLLNYVNPPRDYVISSVMLDGKKINFSDETLFTAEADGEYKFIFKNPEGILPNYSFTYERLRKMPTLTIEGVGKGGIAEDKVVFTPNEDYTAVQVSVNGVQTDFEGNVIDKDGLYSITVSDDAGNTNTYMVNVDIPLRINPVLALIVIIAAGAAGYFYIRYIRNNIQIR